MASVTEIGTLIDRDPKVRGGRPKIAGTGLSVSRIAGWYKMGMTPEEIALEYPHLTLAQVHAALAYYHVNRDEIEADLAQEEAAALRLEHEFGTKELGEIATRYQCPFIVSSAKNGDQVEGAFRSLGLSLIQTFINTRK